MAVLCTPDFHAAADFFAAFGFSGDETLDSWRPLRAAEGSGAIGLRATTREPEPGYPCALAFETTESLPAFADRLRALGYRVDEYDTAASQVTLTDPDGNRIDVHPAEQRG